MSENIMPQTVGYLWDTYTMLPKLEDGDKVYTIAGDTIVYHPEPLNGTSQYYGKRIAFVIRSK